MQKTIPHRLNSFILSQQEDDEHEVFFLYRMTSGGKERTPKSVAGLCLQQGERRPVGRWREAFCKCISPHHYYALTWLD